jgi:hypothetical protein
MSAFFCFITFRKKQGYNVAAEMVGSVNRDSSMTIEDKKHKTDRRRPFCGIFGWFVIASFGLVTLLAFTSSPIFAQVIRQATDCPRIVPQPVNWVVRVVCGGDGVPQYIEHKWPFGSPENIQSIRVPWGYRDLIFGPSVGAQLTNNGHKESLERGYGSMFIWALLPDVSPHDQRVPPVQDRAKEFDLLTIEVNPVINKTYPTWDGRGWFLRMVASQTRNLNLGPTYRDIPRVRLERRFGLNRIGPDRVAPELVARRTPNEFEPSPHNDLWFDGETPETSGSIIVCGSDFKRDGTVDPDNFPRTLCEHYFAHDGLNGSVIMTYWKKNHAIWREMEQRVTALLNTFKTENKPRE